MTSGAAGEALGTLINLQAGGASLLIDAADGAGRIVALCARLDATPSREALIASAPHGMLDALEPLALSPEPASGSTATPGLELVREGAPVLVRLSAVTARHVGELLEIVGEDRRAGVRYATRIRAGETGFELSSTLHNLGDTPLTLVRMASVSLPAPGSLTESLTFHGRWAHELALTRQAIGAGTWSSESRTGRAGHHAPPFLALVSPETSETRGEALGVHLAWSGDHRLSLERLRDGRVAISAEALWKPGEAMIAPGESWETPALHLIWSSAGLNGLRAASAAHVRARVLSRPLGPRPVQINTWEAVYFDHDLDALKTLADRAAALGVERFVLDDGWFGRRANDRAGLGDWTARPSVYPNGLGPLIEHVRGLGMAFGIWVEPEMVNRDSALAEAHPDWILGPQDQLTGRGQYALDLARPEVSAHLFDALHALLSAHPISYVKWDMNRDLPHACTHAQTRAFHALIDRVRAAHGEVEFEACASGGARTDYASLARAERIWVSDCHDPDRRQAMHAAFSLFFPPEVMGAHVGPSPSHQTGRNFSVEARIAPMLLGHFGLEHDVRTLSSRDAEALREAISLYTECRGWSHAGALVRLPHPDPGLLALAAVSPDATRALVSLVQADSPAWASPAPLRVPGLIPDRAYVVRALAPDPWFSRSGLTPPATLAPDGIRLAGEALFALGVALPIFGPGRGLVLCIGPVGEPEG